MINIISVSGFCCMIILPAMRRSFVFTIFFLLLFPLFFCGCTKEPEPPKEKVRIAVAREMLAALAIIADSEGLFSQNGIDAEVKYYEGGKVAMDAMLSGEADVSTVAETPVVFSSFERQDFSVIASIGSSDNEPAVIARRDRGIHNAKDLTGKHIATVKGVAIHYFLSLFMMKHGMSSKNTRISFMEHDEMPGALVRGETDALFCDREPYISQTKALLGDNAVIFSEPGMYVKIFNLVGLNRFIKAKPEAVKKLLKSLIMAEMFARKNKDRAMDIVSAKLEIKKNEAAAVWPELVLRLSLGHQLIVALEYEARWAIGAELTDAKKIPDYFMFINSDALMDVKPEAVTLIR